MNYALKLLIPLALGAVAAITNWLVLSANTQPVYYVTVKQRLDVNGLIDLNFCEPLAVPPSFRDLSKTMVPYSDRGVLSGRAVRRPIEVGDPIFFADTDLGGKWLALGPDDELFPVELDDVTVDSQLLRIGNQIRFRVPPTQGRQSHHGLVHFELWRLGQRFRTISVMTGTQDPVAQ